MKKKRLSAIGCRLSFGPLGRARAILAATCIVAATAAPTAAQQVTLRVPTQSARVYARNGALIAELGPQVRTNISLKSLPAYVPAAFVAVEDKRFFDHYGVDPVGVARAVKENLEGNREGASTITQQLIGAMYPETVNRQDISLERKLREARLAVELEQRYGKERILESYLNWIYFGHGWFGIEAAARHYFGKSAAQLNIEETAMLAALPKGAGIYSPKIDPQRALERRNLVLDIMAQEGVVRVADATAAKRRPVRLAPNHGYAARPPYVIDQVKQFLESRYGADYGKTGLRVWTTIDPAAQNAADSALVRGLRAVEQNSWYRAPKYGSAAARASASGTNYLQGLVVSVDARTGEILAMVGGRDHAQSEYNRVTQAMRQPGSSFKPFVYASAIERGVTPSTVMQDTALHILLPGSPVYEPKNSDDLFRGPITVRQALTQSINTVAIQLGMGAGLQTVASDAKRFGITARIPPYPSSMIGAGAVRPLELAGAYTALANRGLRAEPFLVRQVRDATGKILVDTRAKAARTMSPEVAFLVTDMLKDAAEKGTGAEARSRLPARVPMAGKTGTTDNGTDVWYVGYTPEIVTAVWLGFDTPRSIGASAYGGTLAAPIWGDMMREVYARRTAPAPWTVPGGLVTVATDPMTGRPAIAPGCPTAPAKPEYFPAGKEPAGACVIQRATVTPTAPVDSIPLETVPADTTFSDFMLGDPLPPPPASGAP
ncbi:MAG: PBP1A family penicillin-binding protein [Gemmatimonadetes bacterium]|nr:PBP1A family penicillin-binding protein [Gemmatimonadota bacterium]